MTEEEKTKPQQEASKPFQGHPTRKTKTLLTEELPAGGLTQEDFQHQGRNIVDAEEEEEES